MLNEIQLSLQYAEYSEKILRQDIEHLAQKYIDGRTDFEFPVIDEDVSIPEISFQSLLHRLKNKVIELCPNMFLDETILHGYIDYYLDLLHPS